MKSILITGSTDGIGKLAAEQLATAKHEIILHGRNEEKLQLTIEELKSKTQNPNIKGVTADLSDLQQIDRIVNYFQEHNLSLDVLINNAGVFKSKAVVNKDGIDLRFVVNYLAPIVVTQKLLPLIKDSQDGRIINLSSAAQESVSLEVLKGEAVLSAQSAYAQSKLALTMWSFDLGSKLENIAVVPVNPGSLLNTKMVEEAYGRFWSSADKGANILTKLALEDEYSKLSGKYFDNDLGDSIGKFGPAHPDAYDADLINELNEATKVVLNKLYH